MICRYPNGEYHDFVIYRDDSEEKSAIHLNTEFRVLPENDDGYLQILRKENGPDYDRYLCATEGELKSMPFRDLQTQALRSWLDGTR